MASNSEVSYGARLNNATTIHTHLLAFKAYAPLNQTQSAEALLANINAARDLNSNVAANRQGFSGAVETRQKLFTKDPDSLKNILPPLGAAVRSIFGKNSKVASDIAALIVKIRGEKIKKDKAEPDAESVSQSQRSFGSVTQHFADIVSTLQKIGGEYKPANVSVKLDNLSAKLQLINQANTNVPAAWGAYKESADDRAQLYKDLSAQVQGIKDAVKSQYGLYSTEYNLVKTLKV